MPTLFGIYGPTDEEAERAVATGRRWVGYRWGTMWVRPNGWYVAFQWKVWILGVLAFMVLLVILRFTGKLR